MPKKKLPHIILVVLDTARAKSFSCYGYHRPTTPNIDRIAEEGVLYRWCFSPANWTIPSHASLFTGLYPSEHGCHAGNVFLADRFLVLPEMLAEAGYFTVGISCNGLVSKLFGFARGFRLFYEFFRTDPFYGVKPLPPGLSLWGKLAFLKERYGLAGFPGELIKRAVRKFYHLLFPGVYDNATPFTRKALAKTKEMVARFALDHPLFVFVNLMQTHAKYNPPPEARTALGVDMGLDYPHLKPAQYYAIEGLSPELSAKLRDLYDAEIYYADHIVGELYRFLGETGLLDGSIFIVTSDHGELLGEHGGLLEHHYSLYDELCLVPLIVRYPHGVAEPGTDDRIAQLTDLYATLSEVADLPYPVPWCSESLLSHGTRKIAVLEEVDAPLRLALWTEWDPSFPADRYPWGARLLACTDREAKLVGPLEVSQSEKLQVLLRRSGGEEVAVCNLENAVPAGLDGLKEFWLLHQRRAQAALAEQYVGSVESRLLGFVY